MWLSQKVTTTYVCNHLMFKIRCCELLSSSMKSNLEIRQMFFLVLKHEFQGAQLRNLLHTFHLQGSNFIFLLIYWPYWKKVTPKIHNSHAYKALLFQLSRTQITPPAPLSHFACRAKISRLQPFWNTSLENQSKINQSAVHSFNNSCGNPRTLLHQRLS